jgi:hypothetical protein
MHLELFLTYKILLYTVCQPSELLVRMYRHNGK